MLAVIGLIVVLGILSISGQISFLSLSPGLTVTAISTSAPITQDSDLKSLNWLITTVFNGGGQSIVGTLTPEQTKSLSGYESQYPLTIEASAVDERVTYNVINRNNPITKYTYVEKGFLDSCPSGTAYEIFRVEWFGKICVSALNIGVKGELDNPTIKTQATIKLTTTNPNTIPVTKTISSNEPSIAFTDQSGQSIATATITGNLVTGDPAPNQNVYAAVFADRLGGTTNKYWHLTDANYWTFYQAQFITTKDNLANWASGIFPGTVTKDQVKQTIWDLELKVADLVKYDMNLANFYTEKIESTSETGGKFAITLDRKIMSPEVLFRVRADWIGVKIDTGIPQIVSASSSQFESGKPGFVNVNVKNIGTATGTFYAQFLQCDPFSQKYSAQSNQMSFAPSEQKVFNVEITGGSYADSISKSCEVRVFDFNNPLKYASSTVFISMSRVVIPTTTTLPGAPSTTVPGTPPPSTELPMTLIVAGLIGLLAGLFAYMTYEKKKVAVAIAITVALLVGTIAYLIFEFVLKNWLLIAIAGTGGLLLWGVGGITGLVTIYLLLRRR